MAESADILRGAAPEGRPARPRRRLLDGRHGRPRSARDRLARARTRWASTVGTATRASSRHLHQLVGGDQSVRRRARRRRLHVHQRRGGDGVGVGARREAADAARPASRAQHRATRWACRSIEMVVWDPNEIWRRARRRSRSSMRSCCCGRATARSTRASPSQQIEAFRKKYPGGKVIAHPECTFDVVQAADDQRLDRAHHRRR